MYLQNQYRMSYTAALARGQKQESLHDNSIEYPYYLELKELQIEWLKDNRDIFDLNTSEISKLETIAASSRGIAGAQARGILSFAYDTTYNFVNCISMPDTTLKAIKVKNEDNTENEVFWIKASPNPANNNINFSYSIGEKENAVLSLFSQTGVLIEKILLEKTSNNYHFDCSSLNPGIYYYSTTVESNTLTGKFVIVN